MFETPKTAEAQRESLIQEIINKLKTRFDPLELIRNGEYPDDVIDEAVNRYQAGKIGTTVDVVKDLKIQETELQGSALNGRVDLNAPREATLIEEGQPESKFIHTYGGGGKTAELSVDGRKKAKSRRLFDRLMGKQDAA